MEVTKGLKFSTDVRREWFDMVGASSAQHPDGNHPAGPDPARKMRKSMNYVGKMLLTKIKELTKPKVYTDNDPTIFELMTKKFISIDAMFGEAGTTHFQYKGDRVVTEHLKLIIPGHADHGWANTIANNFEIIDRVLGELKKAMESPESAQEGEDIAQLEKDVLEDASLSAVCVYCGKEKGEHYGPAADPVCYAGNPFGRRFRAVEETVMAAELVAEPGSIAEAIDGYDQRVAAAMAGMVAELSSEPTPTAPEDLEEGSKCPQNNCDGTLDYEYRTDDCNCHISPPCSQCVEKPLRCRECGFEVDVNEQNYGADGSGGH